MARAATVRAPSSSRRRSRRPSGTACRASSVETVGCPYQPSNTAIASPSLSVTIAFFQAERRPVRPERPPVRRRARTTRVRTSVTVTLNSASIAARICGLVAAVSTRKAYSLRAWYAFRVDTAATKPQIRTAIEALFKVTVTDVRTLVVRARRRTGGLSGRTGRRSAWKKAIVTLKEGDAIAVFEG